MALVDLGHPALLVLSRSLDIALASLTGGRLIEVFGHAPRRVLSVVRARLRTA